MLFFTQLLPPRLFLGKYSVKRNPCPGASVLLSTLGFPLVFLKWEVAGVREWGRMESLPINAEQKGEATQRDTSSETELFGFSFAKW